MQTLIPDIQLKAAGDDMPPPRIARSESKPARSRRWQDYRFRRPAAEDGAILWELVKASGVLDLNSAYSYLMLGAHFADTCVVAERRGRIRGFVAAFSPPERPESVFVWQIAVTGTERGRGLAKALLHELVRRPSCSEVRYLEATVTPSNRASRALFSAFARDLKTRCSIEEGFAAHLFPGEGKHEPEHLFRIGPFDSVAEKEKMLETFEKYESSVRSYCRSFPALFTKARGCRIWSDTGREYIDFFSGAGALNYGHNEPAMKEKLIEYISADGIAHSLDMATDAKARLLERFAETIMKPRGLDYKVLFPGPTGTNSVEAALKLARKVTGRTSIVSFTNGFHGMTLGSLSVTGNSFKRNGAGVPLDHAVHMPFDGYLGEGVDTIDYLERMLSDSGSGVDLPAAAIVETVQGEGGLHTASPEWLRRLEQTCRRFGMLLIVDDVQAGCGRTGTFFSFEPAGIEPDIVCLSKSISGYGLPLALTLVRPQYDKFAAGEHNGTFRGHNLAFVTATEALSYWENDDLERAIETKSKTVHGHLQRLAQEFPALEAEVRGRGLMQGLAIGVDGLADEVCAEAFTRGLIMETSGPKSEVIKLLPALTIENAGLERGLAILDEAIRAALATRYRQTEDQGKSVA